MIARKFNPLDSTNSFPRHPTQLRDLPILSYLPVSDPRRQRYTRHQQRAVKHLSTNCSSGIGDKSRHFCMLHSFICSTIPLFTHSLGRSRLASRAEQCFHEPNLHPRPLRRITKLQSTADARRKGFRTGTPKSYYVRSKRPTFVAWNVLWAIWTAEMQIHRSRHPNCCRRSCSWEMRIRT